MRLRFVLKADEAVQMLSAMETALDLREGLGKEIADELRADAQRQFAAGGIEPAWPALKPRTVARKRAMGYPRLTRSGTVPQNMVQRGQFGPQNILMRTGALLESWTKDSDPHHHETVEASRVETGSELPYALAHQTGAPPRLPRRAIGVTKLAKDNIAALVASRVAEGGKT